jgi:hypothetical protein
MIAICLAFVRRLVPPAVPRVSHSTERVRENIRCFKKRVIIFKIPETPTSLYPCRSDTVQTDSLHAHTERFYVDLFAPLRCGPSPFTQDFAQDYAYVRASLPSIPAERPPSGPGWLHEIKLDCFRMLARRDPAGVRLLTRNWAARYPGIMSAVNQAGAAAQPVNAPRPSPVCPPGAG